MSLGCGDRGIGDPAPLCNWLPMLLVTRIPKIGRFGRGRVCAAGAGCVGAPTRIGAVDQQEDTFCRTHQESLLVTLIGSVRLLRQTPCLVNAANGH